MGKVAQNSRKQDDIELAHFCRRDNLLVLVRVVQFVLVHHHPRRNRIPQSVLNVERLADLAVDEHLPELNHHRTRLDLLQLNSTQFSHHVSLLLVSLRRTRKVFLYHRILVRRKDVLLQLSIHYWLVFLNWSCHE